MLHELIFALNGFPGRIFIHNKDQVIVDSNLPFIHPSEVAIFNHVLKLATYFLKLQQFVEDKQADLYLSALQDGLKDILHDYRQVLVNLEAEIIKDKHLTLSFVQCQLENYQLLLFTLVQLIDEISTKKVHGCCLLSLLYNESFIGDPLLSKTILKLLNKCNQVFYYQLASWLFKGILPKEADKFFILSKNMALDKKPEDNENKLIFAEDYSTANNVLSLNVDMLPIFITPKIGQQILFIGESIGNFKINKPSEIKDEYSSLIDPSNILQFSNQLKILSQESEFPIEKFEEFIENVRRHISEKFYKVIVVNHDLVKQLTLVKEFFLVGRGELYLVFINHAKALLHAPINKTTQFEVNQIFQKAAHQVFLEDQIIDHFKFVIENEGSAEDSWSCLSLTYNCKWPFHAIFTKDILSRYNQLLRFLLKIKRVELALNRTWMVGRQNRTPNMNDPQSFLRNHMAFFVNNFQYYLQVDVIESQFNILLEKIGRTTDFDEIQIAHDRFLASLFAQGFLNADVTHKCCNDLLNLCISFCRIILSNNGTAISQLQQEQMQDISKAFNQLTQLLLQMLSSVQQRNKHSHLSQLLLRVDFNRYFSTKNMKNK